ncbi:serine hydrolase domain-containing protein [Xanthovirga aplysinae]|uniref:serine hydrolase domain-containing protein n=1 Tax=Xanthovirga aplysinae TaxID=2529853 RepID=UPI0012BC8F4E|nr:serine hydrolase [Xanthovirga aplysinae]MTI30530.1 class C beta-lactamase-related serine hydrolase [Xanthovirga aplysinae]
MKKVFYGTVFILLLALSGGAFYASERLPIMNGYAAKMMCSCVFEAGRNPEDVQNEDLNFSPVNYTRSQIDKEKKTVTSTVFGFGAIKAVFREGLGCTLLVEAEEGSLRKQTFQKPVINFDPDTILWPQGNKMNINVSNDFNRNQLEAAVNKVFGEDKKTKALLVVHDNQLVVEKYGKGFNKDTKTLGWSMTKSITSALVGILTKQGKLDIHQPLAVEAWKKDNRKTITLHHLMQMNSGLTWREDYGDISDVTKMLYKKADMGNYALQSSFEKEPGENWLYSSGSSNIVSYLIRNVFENDDEYFSFPYRELFMKIGMHSITLEPDASGTFVGSSYAFATPRDWARFGMLYLNDGVWNGERILPEGWVDYSTTPAKGSGGKYGVQWWLNRSKHELPDCPEDIFFCDGFQGQRIYVVPSKKLVVVRLGFKNIDLNEMMVEILKAFPDQKKELSEGV